MNGEMGSELIGGAISTVSLLVGFTLGRAHRPSKKPPREICQCEHDSSVHDKDGCHASHMVESKWDELGDPIGWTRAACACVRYVGPNSSYIPELDG